MKTETAVTWLNSELERLSNQIGVNLSWAIIDDLIKDAKEKEKQQIIKSYETAMETDIYNTPLKTGDQYFNETFNE